MKKAGEEEDWKKKTIHRVEWKRLSDEALKKLRAAFFLSPLEKRGRERELWEMLLPHFTHTYNLSVLCVIMLLFLSHTHIPTTHFFLIFIKYAAQP